MGSVCSGGYGYGIGAYLIWAYVRPACAEPGTVLQVMTLGHPRLGTVLGDAVWDPENRRPRA